jgi:hypothetical protein
MAIDALAAHRLRRGSSDIETERIPAIPVNSRQGRVLHAVEAESIPSKRGAHQTRRDANIEEAAELSLWPPTR